MSRGCPDGRSDAELVAAGRRSRPRWGKRRCRTPSSRCGIGGSVPRDGPGRSVDLGIGISRLLHVMRPRKSPELLSAEDELLIGVEHGDDASPRPSQSRSGGADVAPSSRRKVPRRS